MPKIYFYQFIETKISGLYTKVNLSTQCHAKFQYSPKRDRKPYRFQKPIRFKQRGVDITHEKLLVILNHQFVCTFPHGWTKSEEKNHFCL